MRVSGIILLSHFTFLSNIVEFKQLNKHMMKFAVVYIGATFIVFFFFPFSLQILGVLDNVITPRLCEFLVTEYY